ncbi:hypothetical protein [Mycobacterium phage Weirdo19]|uniref:Uncharacterized protein n=1 Tax=Mycobacterium phage Weirdo19 TaxID=2601610 RepID=A0A6M2YSZ0_9CAUD|nr:hypothetical protein KDJ11_gp52 [Mycobacterium phage Weirdo19]QEA10820.1 hypothetical protein [Mycobacterium phage Weirdo19]
MTGETALREHLAPLMGGALRSSIERGVRIGVEFTVSAIQTVAADHLNRGEPAIAAALRETAGAVLDAAEALLAAHSPPPAGDAPAGSPHPQGETRG